MQKQKRTRRSTAQQARLGIVADLYKRQWSYRRIREEVMRILDLQTYSLATVKHDIQYLLDEWREERVANIDDLKNIELTRIDDACAELWDQWEKSKLDYEKKRASRKGVPVGDGGGGEGSIATVMVEEGNNSERGLGNPAYIAEIRQQLIERRKILGLYAPEKVDGNHKMEVRSIFQDKSEAEIDEFINRAQKSLENR